MQNRLYHKLNISPCKASNTSMITELLIKTTIVIEVHIKIFTTCHCTVLKQYISSKVGFFILGFSSGRKDTIPKLMLISRNQFHLRVSLSNGFFVQMNAATRILCKNNSWAKKKVEKVLFCFFFALKHEYGCPPQFSGSLSRT